MNVVSGCLNCSIVIKVFRFLFINLHKYKIEQILNKYEQVFWKQMKISENVEWLKKIQIIQLFRKIVYVIVFKEKQRWNSKTI